MLSCKNNSLLTLGQNNMKVIPETPSVRIYCRMGAKTHEVALNCDGLTGGAAILMAIQTLNQTEGAKLKEDADNYELYPAKKSGKRMSDMPAIDASQ